jgi:tRNA pseudouridine55 synthase
VTDADKTYIANIKFGVQTRTGDAEGEVVSTKPVNITTVELEQACQKFLGEVSQVPPMYSALKHKGKPLYEYARAGIEIERPAREVTITKIAVDSFINDEAIITISCSKGTYIRTLAEDIANTLDNHAHLTGLRRIETAGYDIADAMTIEAVEALAMELRDAQLLPVDSAISVLPKIKISADAAFYFKQGQAVWEAGSIPDGELRVYAEDGVFLGLGKLMEDGKITAKRLVHL